MTHRYGMQGAICRTQDADGSSWVLHRSCHLHVSTCAWGKGSGGWVRAAAAGVWTFPLPGHVSPNHGIRERVYNSAMALAVCTVTECMSCGSEVKASDVIVLLWRHCCRSRCYNVGVQHKQRAPKAWQLQRDSLVQIYTHCVPIQNKPFDFWSQFLQTLTDFQTAFTNRFPPENYSLFRVPVSVWERGLLFVLGCGTLSSPSACEMLLCRTDLHAVSWSALSYTNLAHTHTTTDHNVRSVVCRHVSHCIQLIHAVCWYYCTPLVFSLRILSIWHYHV